MKRILLTCIFAVLSFVGFSQDSTKLKTLEEVVVTGLRPTPTTPSNQTTLSRKSFKPLLFGQEVPQFLGTLPSVTTNTDGGNYLGYNYFRIRGIDQTRINATLDGIPLNEPEDQGYYSNNYPDFMSSVSSVQLVKGVGTSSFGTPSYGGSLNFTSNDGSVKSTEGQVTIGSFGTKRLMVAAGTGRDTLGFSAYFRGSLVTNNGYRYNTGTDAGSFFLSLNHVDKKWFTKAVLIYGQAKNELGWYAVPESVLEQDHRTNFNTEREKDRFNQIISYFKAGRYFGSNTITASVYVNKTIGYWDLDMQPISGADTVFRYGLDGTAKGVILQYSYEKKKISIFSGMHYSHYQRDHELNLAQAGSFGSFYENTGRKNEVSAFTKVNYQLVDKLNLLVDAEYRKPSFSYAGDMDFVPVNWSFFNPKAGLFLTTSDISSAYLSFGIAHREPTRTDMFGGADNFAGLVTTQPEKVTDIEAGYRVNARKTQLHVNFYSMNFQDELTWRGALGSNSLPLMQSVSTSYRRGVEVDVNHSIFNTKLVSFLMNGGVAISKNQIEDNGRTFVPLYTPNVVITAGTSYRLYKLSVGVNVRYQSGVYLDWENTAKTNPFGLVNATVGYQYNKKIGLTVLLNNLLNAKYYTNGYVVGGEKNLFVNPPRNIMATLTVSL